jgi:hypothetical protein
LTIIAWKKNLLHPAVLLVNAIQMDFVFAFPHTMEENVSLNLTKQQDLGEQAYLS